MYTFKDEGMLVPAKVWSEPGTIEEGALEQLRHMAALPFAVHHVALMADGHVGYGMPIGGVLATKDVVICNAVGVDIGCGVCAVKTSWGQIPVDAIKQIMGIIRETVPVGFSHHKESQDVDLMPLFSASENEGVVAREYEKALKSIGTLGGGNHFIELQRGSDGFLYIMIHSGSRNLGKQVAEHYNDLAVQMNRKYASSVPEKWELAFLPLDSKDGESYMSEMRYCVEFALANRKLMMERCQHALAMTLQGITFDPMINIAHNYAAIESHFGVDVVVHRKGATLATVGTIGLIPGSQGTKSYVVTGKGSADAFDSSSHGAGRRMGRGQAIRSLDLEEEKKKLDDQGIVHGIRNAKDLDEAPGAYKNIEEVMANQADLVEILVELTPLAVVKG